MKWRGLIISESGDNKLDSMKQTTGFCWLLIHWVLARAAFVNNEFGPCNLGFASSTLPCAQCYCAIEICLPLKKMFMLFLVHQPSIMNSLC